MPNQNKNKGKSFEREVSKYLTELYSENFQRVIDSGAFVGGKNSKRQLILSENQIKSRKGDIVPPDDWKYFNCECKSYSQFPFHHLFNNKHVSLLDLWIKQTLETAGTDDCNIIIMKINRRGRFALIEKKYTFEWNKGIDYIDERDKLWFFTGFENFFNVNKEKFRFYCCDSKK